MCSIKCTCPVVSSDISIHPICNTVCLCAAYNLGQKIVRTTKPRPGQSLTTGIRNDPAGLQYCFCGVKGEYLLLLELLRALLKLDMVSPLFLTFLSKIVASITNQTQKCAFNMNISRGKNSLINVTVINSQNYLYYAINTDSSFYIPKNLPYKRKERIDVKSTKIM